MFNKLKNIFKKSQPKNEVKRPVKKSRVKKEKSISLSEKDIANVQGQPYISILKVEIDPQNINSGSFELDWNDKFIINLIKAGYKQREDDTDQTIVDRWFQTVCRNIALEIYEQQAADPSNREYDDIRKVSRKDLGNGRAEIS